MVKLLILLFLVILIISVYAANTLTKTVLDRNYELQQDSSTLSKDPEEAERAVQILCGSKEWREEIQPSEEVKPSEEEQPSKEIQPSEGKNPSGDQNSDITGGNSKAPDTGDQNNGLVYLYVLLISAVLSVIIVFRLKKRNNSKSR